MKIKIFRNLFFSCALTALLVSLLISLVMYNGYRSNIQQNVKLTALDYQKVLDGSQFSNNDLLSYIPSATYRVTLISHQGDVLYDNKSDTTENHSDRPEIIAALDVGVGSASRYSDTLQTQTYYYAVLLDSGNVLRVSVVGGTIISTFLDSSLYVIFSFIVVLIFSYLIAKSITVHLVKPINAINVEHPTENRTYDELSPLLVRIENQNNQLKSQTDDMQKMRDELSEIMQHMEEGLIVLNSKGAILSINQTAVSLFNKDEKDCVGRYILELHRGENFEKIYDIVQHGENDSLYIEENNRIYHVSISTIKSGGSIILFVDSTQQRLAERMRREFSANVSHELKTPLQTISGYAELLKNNMVQEEDKHRFIEKIYDESNRMGMLIQDIIKLSHLDEDAKGMSKENVDIAALIRTISERLAEKAAKKNVTITINADSTVIKAVPTIIDECIFNIVDNAIEYNKEGGSVEIDIIPANRYVTLRVDDSGIGIPNEEQSRVFERFYRVEKSRCRSNGGTGLGLSIVKHAVAVHGGEVELVSADGEGTTITIRLPK